MALDIQITNALNIHYDGVLSFIARESLFGAITSSIIIVLLELTGPLL